MEKKLLNDVLLNTSASFFCCLISRYFVLQSIKLYSDLFKQISKKIYEKKIFFQLLDSFKFTVYKMRGVLGISLGEFQL